MKNNIVMLMIFFTVQMHAMEQENRWSITVGNTTIDLIRGSMLDTYAKEDRTIGLMVLGHFQQAYLDGYPDQRSSAGAIGQCKKIKLPLLRIKKDDEDKEAYFSDKKNSPIFLTVVEPFFGYTTGADNQDDEECFKYLVYFVSGRSGDNYTGNNLDNHGYSTGRGADSPSSPIVKHIMEVASQDLVFVMKRFCRSVWKKKRELLLYQHLALVMKNRNLLFLERKQRMLQ